MPKQEAIQFILLQTFIIIIANIIIRFYSPNFHTQFYDSRHGFALNSKTFIALDNPRTSITLIMEINKLT